MSHDEDFAGHEGILRNCSNDTGAWGDEALDARNVDLSSADPTGLNALPLVDCLLHRHLLK
jgi:hypothetical protein